MSSSRTTSARNWATIVALAALTAVLAFVAGPVGAVAGLATAVAWSLLGLPYAVAVGHVVLATAFLDGIGPTDFVLVELAFGGVLLASTVRRTALRRDAVVTVAAAVGLVGIAWGTAQTQPLWIAAATLLVAFAFAAYGIHRYELVRVGLVSDDRLSSDT